MEIKDLKGFELLRDVMSLLVSASSWMNDAIRAWASGDFAKASLLAPLAVEHLGKAVLWNANPVLVVPLNPRDEASLILLATNPNLGAYSLKTIGLRLVLDRVEKVMGGAPALDQASKERMVNVRNGITHVGAAELSRHVLLDALTVTNAFLENLNVDREIFYGANAAHVAGLLDEKQTETGHRVLEKRAAAAQRVGALKETLGEAEYLATAHRLEGQRDYLASPTETFGADVEAVDQDCPVCQSLGRMFGYIELEEQMDFDVEPFGDGRYEPIPMPHLVNHVHPAELRVRCVPLLAYWLRRAHGGCSAVRSTRRQS
jgi:8-oxo-dGTP pyrophosphatase MutT (NUDIX family)